MGIGTLKIFDPSVHELLTEKVDEKRWWEIVRLIIDSMMSQGIERVHAKYGFIMARDEDGLDQETDRTVDVDQLENLIAEGLQKGTIEYKGPSDFVFESEDRRLIVMLCNDSDIHFASRDAAFVFDLGQKVQSLGVRVYYDGKLL